MPRASARSWTTTIAPAISVVDERAGEGDGSLVFTVSLDMPSGLPVSVDWSTGDSEVSEGQTLAEAGMDYTADNGRLEFEPGATSMTIGIALLDDMLTRWTRSNSH